MSFRWPEITRRVAILLPAGCRVARARARARPTIVGGGARPIADTRKRRDQIYVAPRGTRTLHR